jgi:aminopeptidase-like protein
VNPTETQIGTSIYGLATELFPIARSITGDGVRETLKILQREISELEIHEVPSGTKAFDWTVPLEWNIHDAYIVDPDGAKIVDFKLCNLHVVSYSIPVDIILPLEELQNYLHSLPEQPDAIPYLTSYYKKSWGFCITHNQRQSLKPGNYRVVIDSILEEGFLTYGEVILPGESTDEIFLSTYICHPSMGNNELSGPSVTTYLAKWLRGMTDRRYTYRLIFIPETIGSIVYLSRNLDRLKNCVVAGFNVTCIGDDRSYSYLPSRAGDTLADRVARHTLKHLAPDFVSYSFLERGSDERQYCSPGIDLPVASVMRTKYHTYPEYHTSKDDLSVISPRGLFGGYQAIMRCIQCLEENEILKSVVLCEPQLSPRGLYPTLSTKNQTATVAKMMDIIAYSDGEHDLLSIAEVIKLPMWELLDTVNVLKGQGILVSSLKNMPAKRPSPQRL